MKYNEASKRVLFLLYCLICLLTVFMMVDSEFATSTKTSVSKQNLSIQLSSSDATLVPGLRGEMHIG